MFQVGGHSLLVDVLDDHKDDKLAFEVTAKDFGNGELLMHWGVGKQQASEWALPTEAVAASTPAAVHVAGAWQTPFPPEDTQGCRKLQVEFQEGALKGFQFVLHKKPNEWMKCGNKNFIIDFGKVTRARAFRQTLKDAEAQKPEPKVTCWSSDAADVAVVALAGPQACSVRAVVSSGADDLVLQYGLAGDDRRWQSSTRLNLTRKSGNLSEGSITVPLKAKLLMFVLHNASNNQWLKDGGRDFAFELPPPGAAEVALELPPDSPSPSPRPAPQAPAPLAESDPFKEFVQQAKEEDADAAVAAWTLRDAEIVMIATATDEECNVHALVVSKADLVLQYGGASEDRKWKFSKRVPLARGTKVQSAVISMPPSEVDAFFMFVLHDGAVNRWLKDGAKDFEMRLPRREAWDRAQREAEARKEAEIAQAVQSRQSFMAMQRQREGRADVCFTTFDLERDCGVVTVACYSEDGGSKATAEVRAWLHPRLGPCMLHFGVLKGPRSGEWMCPTKASSVKWPQGVTAVDDKAGQVLLESIGENSLGFDFSMPAKMEEDCGETFVEPAIPGIAFVIKTANGSEWIKPSTGGDGMVRFSSKGRWRGAWAEVADKIVEQEVTWSQMSLKRRYENCLDFVNSWEKNCEGQQMRKLRSWSTLVHVDAREAKWSRMPSMPLCDLPDEEEIKTSKEEFWSWIFVWQRFSFMRLLTWEKNTCTQPRMLAGTTNVITNRMAELWKAHPRCRMWIRWTLSTMGRGGNAGQAIRDQILVIMHAHDIKEIHGTYYEQWHQKLHNNTTPEDIGICRAIITYLSTNGNMGEYWRVLHDHGINKERLASYSRPITTEPYMVRTDIGRLIHDFEDYLRILRSVHDALDLQVSLDHSRWCLPGSLQGKLQDICGMGGTGFANLDEGHGKLMKISDARQEMLAMLNHRDTPSNVIKELLVIDYALETQQSVLVQGMTSETRLWQLTEQLRIMMVSLVGHMPMEDELQAILADWMALAPEAAHQRWNDPNQSALLLKAMSDRISRVVGELSDVYQRLMGPKSAFLGEQVGVPKHNIDVFVDEVLRGTSLIAVSLILQRLEPVLRELAHLPPWQLISAVEKPVQGELHLIDKMVHIQDKVFETPTVLLSGAVSGEEEVPDGVVAVLVRSAKEAPDILSHCAVRARNFGVLLATCFDPAISAGLAKDFEGKWVQVKCDISGNLTVELATRPDAKALQAAADAAKGDAAVNDVKVQMNLTKDLGCKWTVQPAEMTRTNVGSKSLNLALLKPKLPSSIYTPQAVALPFGCMQKALTDAVNKDKNLKRLQDCLGKLQPSSSNEDAQVIFEQAQTLVQTLMFPEGLKKALSEGMAAEGAKDGEARLSKLYNERDAWDAIKGVWASLFAIRPWVSLAKAGRSFHDLNMAVLVQELVEAKYAFVLHTTNPFTHDKDELYGELVAGRGESLVGNYPGRALSFVARRGQEPIVRSFPSKSVALHTQHCLIFRSDSNGEDLEGFAGAGLFESVCAQEDTVGFQRLHRLPVVTDARYRQDLLRRIAEVGWETEKAFDGAAQDIEGCVDVSERIFIVQSRPQV
mmetsp:Transcript_17376/g.40527  ORF Transcript_17376/g.40527 Transcript_17376/m.40527 type:complete len:1562 (-) Transcript_17376:127-4812(-)